MINEIHMEKFLKGLQEPKVDKSKKHFNEKFFESNLNKEQLAIVNNIIGPMIVIAGAGSGKTRVITYSVAKLISNGIKPSEIMLVTFTNKATDEMLKRVENLLGYEPKGLWGGTFHSLANRFIRIYTQQAGLKPAYSIIDQSDSLSLIKLLIDENYPKRNLEEIPSPKICFKILSNAINRNKSIITILKENYPNYAKDEIIIILKEIAKKYESRKIYNNFVDFNDLLVIWNKLLNTKEIAQNIAKKIKYVLVDEYQDTNYLQAQIIFKIAYINKNIMVVGDDAQSIYGFRGADFRNLLNFGKQFPNLKKYKLTHNYRSTSEILDLANNSISNNKIQFSKKMMSTRRNQKKPIHIAVSNDLEQANFIIEKIEEFRKRSFSYSDISILYRSNFHSLTLQKQLQSHKIPFIIRSGISFFEQSHIKDILAFSKIILNYHDELAWRRIFKIIPGIGKVNAEKIIQKIILEENLRESIFSYELTPQNLSGIRLNKKSIENITKFVEYFKEFSYKSIPIDIFNNTLKLIKNYVANNYNNSEKRLKDINILKEIYKEFSTIKELLDDMNLKANEIQNTSDNNTELNDHVVLSTIHRAKGLEWKCVFVISLSELLFPSAGNINNQYKLEEERRIFYVALTRAKDELFLIAPEESNIYKNYNCLKISRFIEELDENLYEKMTFSNNFNNTKKLYNKGYNFITADKLINNKE